MKTKTKNVVILLVIGLVFPLILNYNIYFNNNHKPKVVNPKVSGGYSEPFIHIIGTNWTDTLAKSWCYDDNGVYIIENVTIDASSSPTGSGILIENSAVDFIIRNCTVSNAGTGPLNAGILLDNVNKGTLYNNTCSNNGRYGIMIYWYCDDNIISGNVLINNQFSGIYFAQNCINNKITNNVFNNNTNNGLYLWNDCEQNNITGNIAYENDNAGIKLLENSNNNILSNNTIKSNKYGMYIQSSVDNTITKNIAFKNSISGIYLYSGSENNNISENTVEDNYKYGIELSSSSNWNNITRNTVNDNKITGIYLQSTSDNNIIKNNTINRNDLGILLSSSNFNNISDNILKDNNWCLFETGCTGNIIINNDCTAPTIHETIFIDGAATGVGAHNWTWAESQVWCTGSGTEEVPYVIENLKISGFGIKNGIEIRNSDVYFIIQHCEIFNSYAAGIYFTNVTHSQLIENNCSNNLGKGIYLDEDCSYNNITENIANYNDNNGISIGDKCDFNEVIGNVANDNNNDGISIGDECDNNTISQNTVSYNDNTGIILSSGELDSCYNNTISGNIVNNNTYGIRLEEACHFTKISGNLINGNNFGIYLYSDGSNLDHNYIIENIISSNTLGIYLDSWCSNNSIYENFLLKNGNHAIDNGAENTWNSTIIGNYWDNHTGPDISPQDGIVDNPYMFISGSAGSIDYLPIAEDGTPAIIINSPDDDNLFGSNAPSYSATITDDYLDEMWYTLDGGLHNYTFTEFTGNINQSTWDAISDGSITLTFYASDIPGNIGYEEVNIAKDTQAPIIIIDSPSAGEEFGNNAPAFIITVTDDHLESVWYSLDGGLTNYTITTNVTTINQTAWTALSEGLITITFYANDTLGNLSSEEITITKSIPSAGLDPGVIAVIVVLSVIGGVALLGAILGILVKKGKISLEKIKGLSFRRK